MQGDLLPWRDVLHEGPLAPLLPLEEFSLLRAKFIAEMGWATFDQVREDFSRRDQRLHRSKEDEEVVLWFEHDLYDQLQLVQVLAWFRDHPHPRLMLVCEAEYLGEMKPERAAELFRKRKAVTAKQLEVAAAAWKALPGIAGGDLSALPFLPAALERFRAEPRRTEELIVGELAGGALEFTELFRRTQAKDEPRFLGDTVFRKRLERLEAAGRLKRAGEAWRLA
jgi:hypothetical protein